MPSIQHRLRCATRHAGKRPDVFLGGLSVAGRAGYAGAAPRCAMSWPLPGGVSGAVFLAAHGTILDLPEAKDFPPGAADETEDEKLKQAHDQSDPPPGAQADVAAAENDG